MISITQLESITAVLQTDLAFNWSVSNNDATNMQMVLRAHGYEHSYEVAQSLININI
jgi:hypothetical protein